MKVLLVTPAFATGGVETAIIRLARQMQQRSHQVALLSLRPPTGPLVEDLSKVADIYACTAGWSASKPLRIAKQIKLIGEPDAIVSFLTPSAVVALVAKLIWFGRPQVVHSVQLTLGESVYVPRVKRIARRLIHKFISGFSAKIVACSEGVRSDLQAFGISAGHLVKIFNPIVSDAMYDLASRAPAHPWFDTSEGYQVILGVGRLHKQKNFPLLLRAFSKISPKHPRARLVILGDGGDHEPLKQLADSLKLTSVVSFPGSTENPFCFMARCKVFVLSSDYEGFGNVVAEALALAPRVISTDCQWGPSEILAQGKFGTLVPVGDENSLAEAINCALSSAEPNPNKDESRRAALTTHLMQFDEGAVAEKYLEIIR